MDRWVQMEMGSQRPLEVQAIPQLRSTDLDLLVIFDQS
jgi:hypothetical protein